MIEIVDIKELNPGDLILIEGMEYENQVCVVTVKKTTKDGLIVPEEMGGLDYCPEDSENIVRIGTKECEPILTALAQKMHLAFSKEWQKNLKFGTFKNG